MLVSGLVWFGLVWFDMLLSGLVRFGLGWFGSVGFGLVWVDVVWSGFTPLYRFGLVPVAVVTLLLEHRWRSPRGRNRKPCRLALVSLRLLALVPSLLLLPSFPFTTACS